MQQQYITSSQYPLYKAFRELYNTSFPIFEQRSEEQQSAAFQDERYKLLAFTEADTLVGFISYWIFDTYCYVEHFAVNTDLRGKGYGSHILGTFIQSSDKIVLLEIDPVADNVSEARLRFYKRCGFYENPFPHKHPAYRPEYQAHPLIVLTTKREISHDKYQQFEHDLSIIVMQQGNKDKAFSLKSDVMTSAKAAVSTPNAV